MSTRADEHDHEHDHDDSLPDVGEALPPVDFTTFVLSLASAALVSLGEVPDPQGGLHRDLPLARQNIDLLVLLRSKTHGNLSGEEERLLDRVLVDLRLKFVEAASQASKS